MLGVNSRLDTLQAAVLRVKLRHLDRYTAARQEAAGRYDALLAGCEGVTTPYRDSRGTHVFHQYTIRVDPEIGRDRLAAHLSALGIPSMVYYPVPLHRLPVFADRSHASLPETDRAAAEVLSLPMHTELLEEEQAAIAEAIRAFTRGSGH
jgi:dTDP-4-amino-4,6-dideoxygalactose transaminase